MCLGIGGGLSTTPGIIIVSLYFNKHRALANGICISGTAAGSFVLPMLIEYLVHHFGFHGTILILGGCMLHVCLSAILYRPLEGNFVSSPQTELSNITSSSNSKGCRYLTNSAGGMSTDETKRYIEQLFMRDGKCDASEFYMLNGFGKSSQIWLMMAPMAEQLLIGCILFSEQLKIRLTIKSPKPRAMMRTRTPLVRPGLLNQ